MEIPLRILIIEDSADDAALMVRTLEHGGYAVTWQLVDRRDAMHAALDGPRWDLVISDHSMPGFSSPEALQVLREAGFDTPFILVSGMSPEEATVLMKEIRADDCVLKFELDEMLLPIARRQLREAEKRRKTREGK
jgi:DNA-binding response OmpR family regulator